MPPLRRPAHAPWLACTVASGALLLLAATPSAAATCASLAELELPATTIRSADVVPAGAFTPPGADAALSIPSICRVAGVTQPAVAFEVWLPVNDWNGSDALDGIEDGVLDDPRQCRFDPAVLTCPYGEDHDGCLTPPQVQAVKDIRAGSRDSAGETIFPGLVPGGENGPGGGWGSWVTGREPFTSLHWLAAEGFFKYMVFEDPDWNFRTFDFDADLAFALDKVGAALDSASPDLGTFRDGGSKLIVYHGWSDPDISPLGSINYYENVLATAGGADAADGGARDRAISETQAFFRLFLVPGMGHCSGGPGYNRVDPLPALERWVEDGIAPDTILGTRVEGGEVVRSRPVCAYPGASTWDGAGDPDDAASFRCDASTYASRR
jgi:feruloyl esterase